MLQLHEQAQFSDNVCYNIWPGKVGGGGGERRIHIILLNLFPLLLV